MKRTFSVTAACIILLPMAISSRSAGQAQSNPNRSDPGQTELLQHGQTLAPIVIDATTTTRPPLPLPFPVGGKSSAGRVLSANSRHLTLDGKPWFPVMGEFHYSHYPEADWEVEIQKMKAAGIQVISTYVFWIHHEEVEGEFDWTGQRNLRRFVELCAKNGLSV